MRDKVESVVPVLYVADIERSREFYGLFGFTERTSGGEGTSRWCYLHAGELTMLLASVQPPLITVELPLLLYIYVEDLEGTLARLVEAGHSAERVGYPDHAPGGEARTRDPEGHVLLFGQRTAVPAEQHRERTGAEARFSLIRRAAEAVGQRGGAPERCQVGHSDGSPCPSPAEVKLTDSWGDTAWGCSTHAEETLLTARGAFIAMEDGHGLGQFLSNRHRRRG